MSPFPKFSKDLSLQAESSDFESNLSCVGYLVANSAVIKKKISCDVECRFGVVQDPNVRANESGFAMPPKERSDGAG